jgi:hypothetical protein
MGWAEHASRCRQAVNLPGGAAPEKRLPREERKRMTRPDSQTGEGKNRLEL